MLVESEQIQKANEVDFSPYNFPNWLTHSVALIRLLQGYIIHILKSSR